MESGYDDRDGKIWLDGKLVEWRDAQVHVLTHAMHYASSVFEGERAYNGKIFKILEGQVTIDVAGGEKTTAPLVDFDEASQEVINKWASSYPESVDVYTKWDSQPVIKSSAISQLPNQLRDPAFKGMVSVDLVLNEKGQVISAKVQKSTHAEL